MSREFDKKMQGFLDKKGKRKLWRIILSIAVAFTVFITTYTLILPALTMEKVTCGMKEHIHSVEEGCYSQEKRLICEKAEVEEGKKENAHVHTADCYETTLELTCQKEEHKHTETCYAKEEKEVNKESSLEDDTNGALAKETDNTKSKGEQIAKVEELKIRDKESLLERSIPKLDFVATEENKELLDYYLSPIVRVLVPIDMTDKTFEQAVPGKEDNLNDSFYRFGYNAPENAQELYKSGKSVIYTAYASPMEYSDRVVISYRVFGSIDGGNKAWYLCDKKGKITHKVEERQVEWDLKDFDILKPGKYTIKGKVESDKSSLMAELKVNISKMPEMPDISEHDHEGH